MQRTAVRQILNNFLLLSLVVGMETGCVAVLSDRVRLEAERSLSFAQVWMQPDAYSGRLIIVGGNVVRTTNVSGVTFLEVVQRPLDSADKPLVAAPSEGYFMARCEGYLDPLTYTTGQIITLAGRVLGTHSEKQGEADVSYPLLACVEIYAWLPQFTVVPIYPAPWYWWEWDPWYWDHRYWPRHRPPVWRYRPHHRHR